MIETMGIEKLGRVVEAIGEKLREKVVEASHLWLDR